MKLVIVHDAAGEIVSVVRVEPAPIDSPQGGVGVWAERGDRVAELEVSDEFAELAPTEIAERYRFDTAAKELKLLSESTA